MTEQQKCGLSRDSVFEYTFLSSHVKSRVSENLASSSLSSPPKMSFSFDSTATVASVKCTCVCSVSQSCPNLGNPKPARLLFPWESPGKNTGVSYLFLLQGIFPIQGSNPFLLCLLHWQTEYYHGATWEAF